MHNEGEEIWVRLTGGGPFGLRLGGRSTRWEPLVVAKVSLIRKYHMSVYVVEAVISPCRSAAATPSLMLGLIVCSQL